MVVTAPRALLAVQMEPTVFQILRVVSMVKQLRVVLLALHVSPARAVVPFAYEDILQH